MNTSLSHVLSFLMNEVQQSGFSEFRITCVHVIIMASTTRVGVCVCVCLWVKPKQ